MTQTSFSTNHPTFGTRHPIISASIGLVFALIGVMPFIGYYVYAEFAVIHVFSHPWIPSLLPAYGWYGGSIIWGFAWIGAACAINRQS